MGRGRKEGLGGGSDSLLSSCVCPCSRSHGFSSQPRATVLSPRDSETEMEEKHAHPSQKHGRWGSISVSVGSGCGDESHLHSVPRSGGCKSRVEAPADSAPGEGPHPGCRLSTSDCAPLGSRRRARRLSGLLYQDADPVPGSSPLAPEPPPSSPSCSLCHFGGFGLNTEIVGEGQNIQSTRIRSPLRPPAAP